MKTYRILLVEDHTPTRRALAKYLQEQKEIELVTEAANGMEAFQLLKKETFDMMVTDIIMPQMDGYSLMEEIQLHQLAPEMKIIVISELTRDDFINRACDLGAQFYMAKPFAPERLLNHILMQDCPCARSMHAGHAEVQESIDCRISNLFLSLGIPAHIKGYQFLRYAIKLAVDDPDLMNRITKELYPSIARNFGTSASKVERAIRHAIEVSWNRGRIDALNKTFGCKVVTQEDKPTNGEFIAMLSDKFRMERQSA